MSRLTAAAIRRAARQVFKTDGEITLDSIANKMAVPTYRLTTVVDRSYGMRSELELLNGGPLGGKHAPTRKWIPIPVDYVCLTWLMGRLFERKRRIDSGTC